MTEVAVEVVVKGLGLGEGPHWDGNKQELYFVDVFDPSIQRYVLATGEVFKLPLPSSPSFIIPVDKSENKFVIGYHRHLALLEWDGVSTTYKNLKPFADLSTKYPGARYNDAKCDALGRLWVGTFGMTDEFSVVTGIGALLSVDAAGVVQEHMDKIELSNGLGWSKDSTKMYFIDTYGFLVYVFDYDIKKGQTSNKRVLLDTKKAGISGSPDGMCIDAEDKLWVAFFTAGKILQLDGTTGVVLRTIDLAQKVSNITSLTFGGPNLDTLFVTTGKYGVVPEQKSAPSSATEEYAGAVLKISNLQAKGPGSGVKYSENLSL
ncbi:unnamed protein product [Allacma fusca]|uniref:SMP-30/Gluconolactonase/LRE-like region domain-containing protein n=1 Tax=Allacma fusca TaxID=39272 RepID=A0A8J2K2Q8_9HEXA|nr:unnamed protein product [Allacma fusca]